MARYYHSGNVVSKYPDLLFLHSGVSVIKLKITFLAESSKCRITKVQATPCNMVGEVCKLKRGKNAAIEIDFTPGN